MNEVLKMYDRDYACFRCKKCGEHYTEYEVMTLENCVNCNNQTFIDLRDDHDNIY